MTTDWSRLSMPIGEVMFMQRSTRRLRQDPVPKQDLLLIFQAASKAPSAGNSQPTRFVVLTDPELIRRFGALYREAWWAKRRDGGRNWTKIQDIPADQPMARSAAQLAEEMKDAPCV